MRHVGSKVFVFRTMLEDLGMDEEEEESVPLPNVNAAILKKVITWATHHKVMQFSFKINTQQFVALAICTKPFSWDTGQN